MQKQPFEDEPEQAFEKSPSTQRRPPMQSEWNLHGSKVRPRAVGLNMRSAGEREVELYCWSWWWKREEECRRK